MTTKTKAVTPPQRAEEKRAALEAKAEALTASLTALEDRAEAVAEALDLTDPDAAVKSASEALAIEKAVELTSAALDRTRDAVKRVPVWPHDRPALAEAVAYHLGDKIHGSQAKAVFEAPEGDVERPEVYVEQSKPHEVSRLGAGYSGSLRIVVRFPAWLGDTSTAETAKLVVRTLKESEVYIGSTSEQLLTSAGSGKGGLCVVRLPQVSAVPEVPEMPALKVQEKAQTVAGHVVGLREEYVFTQVLEVGDARGEQTATVQVSWPTAGRADKDARAKGERMIGRYLPDAGRLSELLDVGARVRVDGRVDNVLTFSAASVAAA